MQQPNIQFNHIMLRVKNPQRSLDFYRRVLGMQMVKKSDYQDGQFSLYFLAFEDSPNAPMIELTHNWGTEDDAEFSYHNGNSEPRGFGHICLKVDDLAEAVAWFDQQQVTFVKRPEEGVMRNIAFIADPDGYWVEIIAREP